MGRADDYRCRATGITRVPTLHQTAPTLGRMEVVLELRVLPTLPVTTTEHQTPTDRTPLQAIQATGARDPTILLPHLRTTILHTLRVMPTLNRTNRRINMTLTILRLQKPQRTVRTRPRHHVARQFAHHLASSH